MCSCSLLSPSRPFSYVTIPARAAPLFLDESGQLDQGGQFALGGIAIRDSDWFLLRELWQETLRSGGWPLERELKWHGIRTGQVPPELADAVYAMLAGAPITCFVCLLDLDLGRQATPEFFTTPEDTYATALMFLGERFQHHLQTVDDVGLIVVDSRHREHDSRLRRFFSDLQAEGTPYMKLSRIVEGLFLGPSHHSVGLHRADLVAAATAAAERGGGQGSGYLPQLQPRFARHPSSGTIDGVGLKRFPDREPRDREHQRLF